MMEGKSQNLLIFLIAAVIGISVVTVFGMNIFTSQYDIIPLPTLSETLDDSDGEDGQENSTLVRVAVTTETVQSVIATMSRPESYYRQVTIQDFWGEDGTGITLAEVWVDYGWTYTVATLSSGIARSSIVGEDSVWWWYEGDTEAMSAVSDQWSADLEGQRIPTYEDVLVLDQDLIVDASYEERGGLACIYVVAQASQSGYVTHYWVSEESGLLVATETWDGDTLVSTMFSYDVERPAPVDTIFAIPGGRVLHRVGASN